MTAMETGRRMFTTSGAPSGRSMLKSLALHVLVLALLMLVPGQVLLRSAPRKRQLDIVFYRPPEIKVAAPRAYLACAGCHEGNNPEMWTAWQGSVHSKWLREDTKVAGPTCASCHGAIHAVQTRRPFDPAAEALDDAVDFGAGAVVRAAPIGVATQEGVADHLDFLRRVVERQQRVDQHEILIRQLHVVGRALR